jgi:hypothetical protein
MTQFLNLAILTKKELMKLLIDEKRLSYRRGYKAGAEMKYRHLPAKKNESLPSVYGDSLPVKESLTSEK